MSRDEQEAFTEMAPGLRIRRWCRKCRRELFDIESRTKMLGPECDPERRTGRGREHHVDQEPLPGT